MIPVRLADAAPALLPCIRPPSAPAGAWRLTGTPRALLRWPVAPWLDELVVWDHDGERRFVTAEHTARWGVPAEVVRRIARENLPEEAPRDPRLGPGDGDSDGYEPSRAVVYPPPPGAVIFVPHTRALWIGDGGPATVAAWLEAAMTAWSRAANPVSPLPYRTDVAGLAPWIPGDGWPPAIAAAVSVARCAFVRREYAWQREEEDAPMAAVEVALGPAADGVRTAFTLARWIRGDPAALPEVDVVVLVEPSRGAILAVRWADLQRIVAMRRTPHAPPRYVPRAWPDAATLGRLAAAAVDPDLFAGDS